MNSSVFYKSFHGVNGPKWRGAKMPEFDPAAINEEMFPDELRFNEYATSIEHINGTGMFTLDYESQGWNEEGLKDFYLEVKRCLKVIGFYGNVKIHVMIFVKPIKYY